MNDSLSKILLSDLESEYFIATYDITHYTMKELNELFNSDLGYCIYIYIYIYILLSCLLNVNIMSYNYNPKY